MIRIQLLIKHLPKSELKGIICLLLTFEKQQKHDWIKLWKRCLITYCHWTLQLLTNFEFKHYHVKHNLCLSKAKAPKQTLTLSTDNPQQEQEQKETEQVKGNKQNKQIIFNQKGLNLLSLI